MELVDRRSKDINRGKVEQGTREQTGEIIKGEVKYTEIRIVPDACRD